MILTSIKVGHSYKQLLNKIHVKEQRRNKVQISGEAVKFIPPSTGRLTSVTMGRNLAWPPSVTETKNLTRDQWTRKAIL